ncbi:MAG TPA: FG-GAP repeat protein, partial [Mycobacteriales bacterium]|nr:FG-GAP repeat protein [Mycobacteriales bacterium]
FDGTAQGLSSTTNDVVWGYKIHAGAGFGQVLAGGNINGHGPADIVTAGAGAVSHHKAQSRIVLLTGGKGGLSEARSSHVDLGQLPHGLQDLREFGESVVVADVTGDGRADVIVGAPGSRNESGVVVVLPGGAGGLQPKRAEAITQASPGIPGAVTKRNMFGTSLAVLVLGHGKRPAIAIGTPGADFGKAHRGATFVLHGDSHGLSSHPVRVIKGLHEHDRLGELVR